MSNNETWVKGLIGQVVTWITRPRHLGVALLSLSSVVLVAAMSGGFSVELRLSRYIDVFKLSTGEGLPALLLGTVAWAALCTWLIGLGMVIWTFLAEAAETDVSRVLVVELRGLIDTADQTLMKAVPKSIKGLRVDCFIDVRPQLMGATPNVQGALEEISHLGRQVRLARGDTARKNVRVIAGGVLQVPLLFYAGALMDDEGKVTLFDWERSTGQWKQLLEVDDGVRFQVTGLDETSASNSAVVAVSASYKVDFEGIAATFPDLPVVHLGLAEPRLNGLWSEETQAALANQFLQTLAGLRNRGVRTVHLVLAVPSSLALRLGSVYDHRNMPDALCYQRERSQEPAYPWSVRMPTDALTVSYMKTPLPDAVAA